MSKKNTNLIERIAEALETIATELQTLNSYLYGIGVELGDTNIYLAELSQRLGILREEGLKVNVNFATFMESLQKATPKPKAAETPATDFTKR